MPTTIRTANLDKIIEKLEKRVLDDYGSDPMGDQATMEQLLGLYNARDRAININNSFGG